MCMKLEELVKIVDGKIACGGKNPNLSFKLGFASDLMSDVLTLREDDILLISGLANVQVIRTAELSDIRAILLVRNKNVNDQMLKMAEDSDITIITTQYSMFKACGLLFKNNLDPIY